MRYVGRFPVGDPLDVPWSVVEHLAARLGIEDLSCVKRYTERLKTAYEREIRDAYGHHPIEDAEGPEVPDVAVRPVVDRRRGAGGAVQPGGGVAAAQPDAAGGCLGAGQAGRRGAVAERRLYATVAGAARRADASLSADLVALLGVPQGRRVSALERLRRPPTRTTGTGLAR
nr:DUF4158 domain-containing protein [Streptomyces bottropensis]